MRKRCIMKRRKYSKEFKEEAVKLSYEEGISAAQVARNLGIDKQLLYKWRIDFSNKSIPLSDFEREELKKLRKENKILKIEREILKKAVSIFSEK